MKQILTFLFCFVIISELSAQDVGKAWKEAARIEKSIELPRISTNEPFHPYSDPADLVSNHMQELHINSTRIHCFLARQ